MKPCLFFLNRGNHPMSLHPDRTSLAVLLVLHGTQEPAGLNQAEKFCEQLSLALREWRGLTVRVYPSFLELAQPSAEQMLSELIKFGFKDILVVPVMLLTGNHVRRDLPKLIEDCRQRNPKERLNIAMTSPFGVRRRLVALARSRSLAAFDRAGVSREEVAYVMVGRGTREEEGRREMEAIFALASPDSWKRTLLCYFAAAEPRVEDALEEAAQSGCQAVLVQPYLLFEGFLTKHLRALLRRYRERFPDTMWIQADVLGPDQCVVDITKENIITALEQMFPSPLEQPM